MPCARSAATVASAVVMRVAATGGCFLAAGCVGLAAGCFGFDMLRAQTERAVASVQIGSTLSTPLPRPPPSSCSGLRRSLRGRIGIGRVAAVTTAEMAGKKPLHRAHEGDAILRAIDAVALVGEQQIFHVVVALAQRSDDAVGVIAADPDVVGALRDKEWNADRVGVIERGTL